MSHAVVLTDKAVRLFTFLAKAQQLRQRPVRDVDQYTRDGVVRWFADLPKHDAVRWGADGDWDEHPFLSVDRLVAPETPEVPDELRFWLRGDAAGPDGDPQLRNELASPDAPAEKLEERPDVQAAYDRWRPRWDAWAHEMLRDEPVRSAYADLFKVYVQATQKTEELELLLGVGLLSWAPDGQDRVRRHLFTVAVTPRLDDSTGRLDFHLDEAATGLHAEFDMLDPQVIPDQSLVHTVEQQAQGFDGDPLDPEALATLARSVAVRLHAQGRWDDAARMPHPTDHPVVAWAPAIVLRPRNRTGLVQAFQDIAAQIEERGEVPDGLLPLLDPDRLPPVTDNAAPGALLTVDDDVVAPLPLNDVQRNILERVDTHAQTLVQGPPGTGKTHTAAALLSHLLAQGQRVLVTAHTDRALHEVRTKLPDQIRPLAVSVIGASRDDLADLRTAVDTIARRSTEHDPQQAERKVHQELAEVDRLKQERQLLNRQLVDARQADVSTHSVHGYEGTLASIARQYQDDAQARAWVAGLVTFRPDSRAPLTDEEALEWLSLLRDGSLEEDAEDSHRPRVAVADLSAPEQFAALVVDETTARTGTEGYHDLAEGAAAVALRALTSSARRELQERCGRIIAGFRDAERLAASWVPQALADVAAGETAPWRGRAADLRQGVEQVDQILARMPINTRVDLDGDPDHLRRLAISLREHLGPDGSLKTDPGGQVKIGFFAPPIVKQCRPLLEQARVDGLPPATAAALDTIVGHRDAWTALDQMDRLWPASVTIPEEDTPRERLEWHRSQLALLDRVLALGDLITAEEQALREARVPAPDWRELSDVERVARTVDAVEAEVGLATAREPLSDLHAHVEPTSRWQSAAPAVRSLRTAIEQRDHEAYATAYARLQRLEQVTAHIQRRDDLTARVRRDAPALAESVGASADEPEWDKRLAGFEAAYRWGTVGAWVLAQEQVDVNALQAKITVVDQQLRDSAERIAAQRAWSHAVGPDRLTPGRRADLRNYSQQVTRLGKGTGKYAAQQRLAIRRAMDRCRPAVPVWIMPIYRVAEQLDIDENMFDVVVVDEASQAGLEATFLQYLAPKIVVIGDDKQVSPAAVGVDQQQLRDLANQYLYDDRYKDTWQDPQRSLFDEAQMRYGGQLTLVEHRRCVPEIIGFSNRIAYEPNGIRLVPVRQFGAQRLEPFVVRHVPEGFEEGTGGKINRAEARALVDDLKRCLDDPAFDGRSMAVISLVGDRQAKHIEGVLLAEVPAEEWARRDLRVGTPPDFQGSERDVVFLSMVSAPDPGRRLGALTREMYVQRFNVAVSRAKDQVRLFHSVSLAELTNTQDLRHQLLDYAYGVVRRGRELEPGESPVVPEDQRVAGFDSLFEQRVHNRIVDRGFTVLNQVESQGYLIDLVVVGARGRLGVECDGDEWHGRDAYERDLARQRELERCGWTFFRVRESAFYVDQAAALAPLWDLLEEMDIRPSDWIDEDEEEDLLPEPHAEPEQSADLLQQEHVAGSTDESPESEMQFGNGAVDDDLRAIEGAAQEQDEPEGYDDPLSPHWRGPSPYAPVEAPSVGVLLHQEQPSHRDMGRTAGEDLDASDPGGLPPYRAYSGSTVPVHEATDAQIIDGLAEIVTMEGPVRGNRLRTAYVQASGGRRVGKAIGQRLNALISRAQRSGTLIGDDPLGHGGVKLRTYRLPDQAETIPRALGPRTLDEMPPTELSAAMARVLEEQPDAGHEQLMRQTLRLLGRTSLTQTAREALEPTHELLLSQHDRQRWDSEGEDR